MTAWPRLCIASRGKNYEHFCLHMNTFIRQMAEGHSHIHCESKNWTFFLFEHNFRKHCSIFAARCYTSAAYVVMLCLSVCDCVCVSVTFVNSVKTNKHIIKIFSPSGSRAKRHSNIPTGTLPSLTGASNAGGIGRNRNSEPISGFTACC